MLEASSTGTLHTENAYAAFDRLQQATAKDSTVTDGYDALQLYQLGVRYYQPAVGRFLTAGYVEGFGLAAVDAELVRLRRQ